MKTPYPHQNRSVTELRDTMRAGKKRVILTLPTGSGKTFVAGMIFQMAQEKNSRCLFLAHRRELIFQAARTFANDFGLDTGIMLAREQPHPERPVQVASKATLAARSIRRSIAALPKTDLLIVDECHLSMASEFRKIMELVSDKGYVIGLTATPQRKTGKNLGEWWDHLLVPVQYQELIREKLLVGATAFAPHIPNMKGVTATKWESEGANRLDTTKLVGDIYSHWISLANGRQTIGFVNTVAHSMHMTRLFRSKGVAAEHVDGKTPKEDRERIWKQLASGDIQVVWNCNVASEGIDIPPVSCVVLAAPTQSLVKYRQRAGRAMRTYPGKEDCLIIDHSGVTLQFGHPDDDWPWKLECRKRKEKVNERNPKEPEQRLCPECYALFYGAICPKCGHNRPVKSQVLAIRNGLLRKVKRKTPGIVNTPVDLRGAWYRAIEAARKKDGQMTMAMAIFRGATGKFPHEVKDVALPHVPSYRQRHQLVDTFVPRRTTEGY